MQPGTLKRNHNPEIFLQISYYHKSIPQHCKDFQRTHFHSATWNGVAIQAQTLFVNCYRNLQAYVLFQCKWIKALLLVEMAMRTLRGD